MLLDSCHAPTARKVRILLKFNGEPIPRRKVFIFSTFYRWKSTKTGRLGRQNLDLHKNNKLKFESKIHIVLVSVGL